MKRPCTASQSVTSKKNPDRLEPQPHPVRDQQDVPREQVDPVQAGARGPQPQPDARHHKGDPRGDQEPQVPQRQRQHPQ